MLRDRQFWAALAAAVLFWLGLWLWQQPALQLGWPLAYPLAFLLPALVYPVLEEIVFRGLIQDTLRQWNPAALGPLSLANLFASLLFSALHFFYHAPLWAALVFLPSLVFGYFKERHNSLAAPVGLHMFYNSGYYWIFAAPL